MVQEPLGSAAVREPGRAGGSALAELTATEIVFRLPALRWEHIQVGERQVLALTLLTPITEKKTRITQVFWSDHPVFGLAKPFLRAGAKAFLKQDGEPPDVAQEALAEGRG